jgi:hypothetical protein
MLKVLGFLNYKTKLPQSGQTLLDRSDFAHQLVFVFRLPILFWCTSYKFSFANLDSTDFKIL